MLAAVFAAAILAAGGLGPEPRVASALELGRRPATEAPPPPLPDRPALLAQSVDGVAFPNWAQARVMAMPPFAWTPVGARRDRLHGRRADTVFYEHMEHRVAYTIVAGDGMAAVSHGIPERDTPCASVSTNLSGGSGMSAAHARQVCAFSPCLGINARRG